MEEGLQKEGEKRMKIKPDEQTLLNKYVILWNERIPKLQLELENDKAEFPKDEHIGFKWGHLIHQEIKMYISLCSGDVVEYNQVPLDDFKFIVDRRGFTPRMTNVLRDILVDIGIGNELKGVKK